MWILPDGMAEPTSPMIKISYYNVKFNDENIMVPDDLYSSDNKNKIHHVNGTYFQFRFHGEKITLPTKSMVVNGNNLIGWKVVGDEEEVTYAPGQEIPPGEGQTLYKDITLIA